MSEPPRPSAFPPTARLHVDLDALADNYRRLQRLAEPSRCAAVVKADAYGLGVGAVSARLAAEGCETFFVATAREAIQLRLLLPQAEIGVFEGVPEGAEPLFLSQRILPVINTLAELERWGSSAPGARAPTILHIDTGMTRLGLDGADVHVLAGRNALLEQLDLKYVMTHLACADEPSHPLTEQQIARFAQLRALLPSAPSSIGNSAGVMRGAETRGDLARPGIALYGGQALANAAFTPVPVVRWQGRVLQVRQITEATSVGYGAAHQVQPPAVVATVAIGYADGYRRALGGSGSVGIGAQQAPVIGRVSMDLISIDVSDCDAAQVYAGAWVDLIGGNVELDAVAAAAGTISYELLTGLGSRAERIYSGDVRKMGSDGGAPSDG